MKFKGKIIRNNNGTLILPYTKGQSRQLEKQTSIWDKVYHKSIESTGFFIKYNDKMSGFVTHQNNPKYLQGLFPQYEIIQAPEIKPNKMGQSFSLKDNITPTEIQYDILNKILNSNGGIMNTNEWFVHLQTSYGKTLLSVYLSSIIGQKTLILCFSTEILKQWIKTYEEKTTFDMSRILLVDKSAIFKAILEDKFNHDKYDVFVCTPKLISSFGKKNGYDTLDIIMKKIGIGLKIFDEAHRNIGNLIKINGTTNIKRTLYLSADFGQANHILEEQYYRIFYNVPIIEPSEDLKPNMRYTQAIVIMYNSEPTMTEIPSINDRYGYNSQRYIDYQFKKEKIFDAIYIVMDKIIKDEYRTLILLNHIDHIDILKEKLEERYNDKYTIGRYHSEVSSEEKSFTKDYSKIIISTYSSFGTGIDTTNIKYVLSLNQSNKIEDNQAAGRARPLPDGSDVMYFMFIDKGFKYCMDKLRSRLIYLKETKIKDVKKINI